MGVCNNTPILTNGANMFSNIESHIKLNTGGGCELDIFTLPNGKVLAVSDEFIGLYNNVEDIFEDDTMITGFYIPEPFKDWGKISNMVQSN